MEIGSRHSHDDVPVILPCDAHVDMFISGWAAEAAQFTPLPSEGGKMSLTRLISWMRAQCDRQSALQSEDTSEQLQLTFKLFEDSVVATAREVDVSIIVRAAVYILVSTWRASSESIDFIFVCCLMNSFLRAILSGKMQLSVHTEKEVISTVVEACAWSCARCLSSGDADLIDRMAAEISRFVSDFADSLEREAPLSIPVSICLVDSVCQYSTNVLWHDADHIETNSGEQDRQFVSFLLASFRGNRKLIFSAWCLHIRIRRMLVLCDPAVQYLLHCMVSGMMGALAAESLLRCIVCGAVTGAIRSEFSQDNIFQLIAPTSNIVINSNESKLIHFIASFLRVFQLFLKMSHHCFSTPFLWTLEGFHLASRQCAGRSDSAEASMSFLNAVLFRILFSIGSPDENAKEALVWMVATCRRSMKLAYEIFVACIHIHTEMDRCLGFGFMEGCLRLLGQHLRLVRATIEAERTLDVKLLQRFDEAWLFLFSISTQGLAANSAQTESIADAASVGLTGQKRKRDNDNIRAAISLLQSEEITVYNNVINVQVKAVHSVEIIRLVNNIVSGRWVHRRENFREGLVISAAAMIALDRSAPTQFLGDNVPSKLLLMCIRDWMEQCTLTTKMPINMHECSKGMKNNLLTGVYDNLCSSVRSDNLDSSMMSHFTKMQMDISLSYDMSCSRLTPSMESMLPPVVNFINRTLMAVQIATELICLSIATGAVDISTKKICSALEVHAGILLPSMLSFILRWSLNTYISRCCVVSDDDRCTCESLLKYAFACIQLSKLVPNVFIRADIVVTALEADENGADIITQLAPLILHGWILSDKYRVKLILEMLSQLCQLLDLFPGSDAHNAESISADAGADNIQQRADYCLLRLLSLFGVGQLRLAPLCVDEVFPLNVEIVKFAENAKSNCRFVQDSRSNTIRLTSDVVILQYADCSSKLKVCNKWLLIDEGIVSLKKICEIEGNTVIAAIGKISLFLGKELAQYSFLLRSSEGGFMILPTIETLLANYMPKYKIEQVLQEEGVTSYRILEDDFCSQSSTKSSSTDAIREEADPFLTFICSSIYLPLIFMNSKSHMAFALTRLYFQRQGLKLRAVLINILCSVCSSALPWSINDSIFRNWMTEGILEYLGVPDEIWEYSENGKFSSCEALIITEDSCKIYLKELLSYQAKLFQCGNYSQLGSIFDFLRKLPASELCGTSDGFKLRKGNVIYNQALVNLQLLEILVSFHKVDPLSNADSKVLSLMLCGFLSRLLFCSSDFWKFFSTVNQDYIACCERKYSLLEEAMLTEIFTLLAKLIDSQDFFLENNKLELQNNSFQLEWHPKTLECIFTRRVCTTRLHKEPQNIDTLTVPESSSMDVIPENHLESKDMSPFRHGTVTAWSQRATPNVDEVIITAPHDPLITSPSGRMHLLSPLAATITDKDSHSEWDEFAETGLCAEIAIPFSTALSNLSLPKLQEVSDNEPIATSVTFDIEAINKKFRRRT